MSQLSTYSQAGSGQADQVAVQARRLSNPREVHVYDFMTAAQIADVQTNRTGSTKLDVRAALQAAIDSTMTGGQYANDSIPTKIFIPAGSYYCSGPLYLDPPENIRTVGMSTDAPNQQWGGRCLAGDGTAMNQYFGTKLYFPYDGPGLVIGSGFGNQVRDLAVHGGGPVDKLNSPSVHNDGAHHGDLPITGKGVVTAAGSAGNSSTAMYNVRVQNFYKGFAIGGAGIDSLGDSNRFFNCHAAGCMYGFHIALPQNYINDLYACNTEYCRYAVYSQNGPGYRIYGGNYSTAQGLMGWFDISGISAFSMFTDSDAGTVGTLRNATFTATLTNGSVGSGFPNLMTRSNLDNGRLATFEPFGTCWECDVNAFVVETANYGAVPLIMTNWNSTTHVATFKLNPFYITGHFGAIGSSGWDSRTGLIAEIQAATRLWTAERSVTFHGPAQVNGVHVENPYAVTTISECYNAVEGGVLLQSCIFQYDVTQTRWKNNTDAIAAIYHVQGQWPLFNQQQNLTVIGCFFESDNGESCMMDGAAGRPEVMPLFLGNIGHNGINLRGGGLIADNSGNFASALSQNNDAAQGFSMTKGYGLVLDDAMSWNRLQDPSISSRATSQLWSRRGGNGQHPMMGRRPATYTMPRVKPSQVTNLVPSPSNVAQNPLIHGDTYYQVSESNTYNPYAIIRHIGHCSYTYGADIPVTYTYRGTSHVLNVTSGIEYMFPGLLLVVNPTTNPDGLATARRCVVTHVQATRGIVYICSIDGSENRMLNGTNGVTYGGTTIGQDRLNIKKFGRQCEFGTAAPSSGSWTIGDICYSTTPAATGFVGWVCTVSGSPGTWKTFGPVSP